MKGILYRHAQSILTFLTITYAAAVTFVVLMSTFVIIGVPIHAAVVIAAVIDIALWTHIYRAGR